MPKIFYHDHFVLPLPENHRFPMAKYRLLRERVEAAGIGELLVADAATDEQLLRAHSAEYLEKVQTGNLTKHEIRRMGFPWSAEMVERSRRSVGSTIAASRWALQEGVSINLAGGTHHAHVDWGQGFCVYNDAIVAARTLQAEQLISHATVIDCDVHQGNGTAALAENDPAIFTYSIHGARNFPAIKATSDLDVPLPDDCDDDAYLEALEESLWRIFLHPTDLIIYIAGADPYEGDRLGKLKLSKAGLIQRDRLIRNECRERNLPVAVVMGGGYAKNVDDIADIHFNTVQIFAEASP